MLTMRQKKAVTAEFKGRYAKLSKKEKGVLLDQFTTLTGYNRSYASRILNLREGKVGMSFLISGFAIQLIYVLITEIGIDWAKVIGGFLGRIWGSEQ